MEQRALTAALVSGKAAWVPVIEIDSLRCCLCSSQQGFVYRLLGLDNVKESMRKYSSLSLSLSLQELSQLC
jgi:hypothetical protein